jgi:branched-chain amino acid transport system substrate-binding protein
MEPRLNVVPASRRSIWLAVGVIVSLSLLALSSIGLPAQARQDQRDQFSPAASRPINLSAANVITIGIAVDLSGPLNSIGWQEANSVQLAISQTNAAGGVDIGGTPYTVLAVFADSPCGNPGQAVTAANTLLTAGAKAVIGHTCSNLSNAAQSTYNAAGVAMISPSSTGPGVTQQGYTTTFRTVSHDATHPQWLATYLRNRLLRSTTAIVDSASWGNPMPGDVYSDTFTNLGGSITSRRWVTTSADFTATLTAIKAENPDIIVNFMEDFSPIDSGFFSRVAHNVGLTDTNQIIVWNWEGNDPAELPAYANAAGSTAADGNYALFNQRPFSEMPGWATFLAAYKAAGFVNQSGDPGYYGPFAYDAANIIIHAIDQADSTNPADIRDQIAATADFDGVVGTYLGFDDNGDVLPIWQWPVRYLSGQWEIMYPMAKDFPTLNNSKMDDFSSTTLGSEWSWLNEDESHWSLTDLPGFLRITTQPGSYGSSNLLLRSAPPGSYDVRTHLFFTPTANFQIAGLAAYKDANNRLMFGRAFCGFDSPGCTGGNGLYFDHIEGSNFVAPNFAIMQPQDRDFYLRLVRQGTRFAGYYSANGTDWELIGVHVINAGLSLNRIGLTASNQSGASEVTADFDYYRLDTDYRVYLPLTLKNK